MKLLTLHDRVLCPVGIFAGVLMICFEIGGDTPWGSGIFVVIAISIPVSVVVIVIVVYANRFGLLKEIIVQEGGHGGGLGKRRLGSWGEGHESRVVKFPLAGRVIPVEYEAEVRGRCGVVD